jgi:nitrite reductase (NAD(P)H)
MGVDVASFGDFFADMRPVDAQARAVSRIRKPISNEGGPTLQKTAEPTVKIAIDGQKDVAAADSTKSTSKKKRGAKKDEPIKCLVYKDPFGSTYKKYIFTADGKYLLGGQMIGDVADYVKLVAIVKKKVPALFRKHACCILTRKWCHLRKPSMLRHHSSLSAPKKEAPMMAMISMMMHKSVAVM